jgi:hypothetical protein
MSEYDDYNASPPLRRKASANDSFKGKRPKFGDEEEIIIIVEDSPQEQPSLVKTSLKKRVTFKDEFEIKDFDNSENDIDARQSSEHVKIIQRYQKVRKEILAEIQKLTKQDNFDPLELQNLEETYQKAQKKYEFKTAISDRDLAQELQDIKKTAQDASKQQYSRDQRAEVASNANKQLGLSVHNTEKAPGRSK